MSINDFDLLIEFSLLIVVFYNFSVRSSNKKGDLQKRCPNRRSESALSCELQMQRTCICETLSMQ